MEICKQGAASYARDTGQPIAWVQAIDIGMTPNVIEKPNLRQEKIEWLQLHDKKCADMYGMLPLVKGMPVSLTTHIDRSEKALLRGCSGTLMGWDLDPREPTTTHKTDHKYIYMPLALYVKFEGAEWEPLEGMPCDAHGVYVITPNKKCWFLDERRCGKSLKVCRVLTLTLTVSD